MSHLNIAFIVTECIMTCIEEDDDLFLITLDAQKAFDKLNHELYSTGDNVDPCRIPCSNGILSELIIPFYLYRHVPLYIFLCKVHKSPVIPSW
jgi:hypothetical protein